MDLNELGAFVKVVRSGSFTRAAEILGMQKGHLSRLIARMERRLGVRLLERTTRSLALTEVGREFYERAVGILGAVEEAESMVQQAQGEPHGVLKLTCGVEFGMIEVGGWIDGYLERYPRVEVEAEFTGRVVDLVHEGFDLAIRVGALPDSSLAARKLGDLHHALFASPDYLARRGAPATPAELEHHALLRFSGGPARSGWRLHQGEEVVEVAVAARLRVNNSFAVRDAARSNGGCSLRCLPGGTPPRHRSTSSSPAPAT